MSGILTELTFAVGLYITLKIFRNNIAIPTTLGFLTATLYCCIIEKFYN